MMMRAGEHESEQQRAGHLLRRNPSSHAGGIFSKRWEDKFCVIVGTSPVNMPST